MLHEAPLPKERNEGSEEHAQPLSLVALLAAPSGTTERGHHLFRGPRYFSLLGLGLGLWSHVH